MSLHLRLVSLHLRVVSLHLRVVGGLVGGFLLLGGLLLPGGLLLLGWPAPSAGAVEPPTAANQNGLIAEYRTKLRFSASTEWPGWPASRAFDGNPKTSWFTARGDAAAKGTKPWIAVEFPASVRVRRVTLLSNREPPWEVGYTIRVGRVEFFSAEGRALYSRDDELGGARQDMEVRPADAIDGVRKIRFTSLGDEGDQNPYDDIAIGEILVE